MSNYNQPTDNPWSDPARDTLQTPQGQSQQAHLDSNNPYYQGSHSPNPWASQQQDSGFAPPPGPPPGHQQQTYQSPDQGYQAYNSQPQQGYSQSSYQQSHQEPAPGLPPRRADTFEEADFIPPDERGEQREMMEHFEMSKSGNQSTDDRNVEALQREFPGLDGSLVAAIYGDSKDMGATREMLKELSAS